MLWFQLRTDCILSSVVGSSRCPCRRNRETSVYNLGPKGIRIRLVSGGVVLLTTIAVAVAMFRVGAHPLWRAALFLPLFAGIVLVLQARARTCVALAAIGAWDLDCGIQRVPDRDLEARLRHRAYVLLCAAFLASILVTGIFALL